MWTHPILLISVGVVALVTTAAAVYTRYRYRQLHDTYEYVEPRIPQFERRVLGPCGICKGDASVIDSFQASCGHHIHYTCAANVTSSLNSEVSIDWSQACMACVERRINLRETSNTRLRNSAAAARECANCLVRIGNGEQNTMTMVCGHLVHEECWRRMQNSASTTCPACMDA